MPVIYTFLKYFISDLPVIITSFICMLLVVLIYLPKKSVKRRWWAVAFIEGFEHLVYPIILTIILLSFSSFWAAILIHTAILGFFYGFLGLIIVRAKSWSDWFRITAIVVFAYFFIFVFPTILIRLQYNFGFSGWFLLILTNLIFIGIYLFHRRRINLLKQS